MHYFLPQQNIVLIKTKQIALSSVNSSMQSQGIIDNQWYDVVKFLLYL